MYIQCYSVAHLQNHCCSGNAIRYKYYELCVYSFLSYLASKSHILASYYTVICGLSGSTIFLHIISEWQIFRKKLFNLKPVF